MTIKPANTVLQRWLSALAVYSDRRILCILFLGFSSGLPLALTGSTLSLWLYDFGIEKRTITLFALVGTLYTFKFVWSPIIDGIRLPFFGRRFGHRRSWIIASQIGLIVSITALGLLNPAQDLFWVIVLSVVVAFFSATQDIVIDAYRVEIVKPSEQGAGSGATQFGYRIGMLISGAGALFIAEFYGWAAAYVVMAGTMLVGVITILLNPEPKGEEERLSHKSGDPLDWLKLHVLAPFLDFLKRADWFAILAFIVLYKVGDALAGVISGVFYREMGFTLAEIASISKIFGLVTTLGGIAVGGAMVMRYGMLKALLICGVLQMLSNLMFVIQAMAGDNLALLTVTIAVENFTGGMGSAAFVAYISSLCSIAFTATQYALFSSLAAVPRTFLASNSGWLSEHMSWVSFFSLSTIAAIPGLLLLLVLMRRNGRAEARPATI